jgi:hypothetical protein
MHHKGAVKHRKSVIQYRRINGFRPEKQKMKFSGAESAGYGT